MSTSVLQYCECGTLFDYVSEDEIIVLLCPNCGMKKTKSKDEDNVVLKISTQNNISVIDGNHIKYDDTMMSTSKITCQNKDCPSNDPSTWKDKFPQLLLANHFDKDRKMKLICNVCSTVMNIVPTNTNTEQVNAGAGAGAGAGVT